MMEVQLRRLVAVVCAAGLLCAAVLAALALGRGGWAQPAPASEAPVGIDQLHQELMQELTQALSEMLDGVRQDPAFLDSPEAEAVHQRVETLQIINQELRSALRPEAHEAGSEANGRFQFVEWIEPGAMYWVVDTRTGGLRQREAPPIE